mgnify:FL=1
MMNETVTVKPLINPVMHRGGQLFGIQVLRFFSALAVSIYHIGFLDPLGKDYNIWMVNGVYIFYAISGYVTMLSTELGCQKFMIKRLIKIFPLYWFLTFATFGAMKLLPSLFPYEPSFSELLKSLFLIPYAHQATATASAMYPIVSMGHTIQTTMLYYLVFWVIANISHKNRGWLSSLVIVIIVACGICFKPSSAILKFYLKPDLIFFIAGIAAFYVCKSKAWQSLNLSLGTIVLASILFVVTMFFNVRWILLLLILLLMCVTVKIDRTKISNTPVFKILAVMGNWTFSYFLIHLYVIRFAEVLGGTEFNLRAVTCDFIAIVIAWGVSFVLYELIEKRFTNVLKRYLL